MGNFGKKVVSASLAVLTSVSMLGGGSFVAVAGAATASDLQAQINALLAQLQAMQTTTTTCTAPIQPLTVGSNGGGVTSLQDFLRANGYATFASTGYFGAMTQAALAKFQAAKGITPAVGYYGPVTAAAVAAMCTSTTTTTTTTTTTSTTLSGGAGSVADYSLASGLSNEEVGEDESDVKVAGLEVEADNGSDLRFTALRLVFNEGTAGSDFDNYADEVSIWLGNNEVARVDAGDFNDNNDWTKTVTLDSDAVIKADKTATFYVAISGINNLDTNDAGDTWTLDFTTVRFQDAQGASISEDAGTGLTTFSFDTFATAANTEFKITSGLDSVNDAHLIDVDATNDTNNVSILSFNVEIKGDSDVSVTRLPVNVTVANAGNVDDMLTGLSLWMDGTEVGSANISSDCIEDADCSGVGTTESYLFDNLDLNLNAGSDYDFLVKADFKSLADVDLDAGDTILATFGETQTDLGTASFKAQDESNTNLADADKTGTVTSSASEVRDIGFNVAFVPSSNDGAILSHAGDIANTSDSDEGTFTIAFDVTAFGGDVYIDGTKPTETGGATAIDLTVTGTDLYIDSNITSPTGATLSGTQDADARFLVNEDETERFVITFVTRAQADGLFQVSLANILYALSDVDGDLDFAFDLTDFKTKSLSMQYDA